MGGLGIGLGVGGKGGARTNVIAKDQIGALQLRHAGNRHTDNGLRSHDTPGQPGRGVFLAHMNSIRSNGPGQ